MYYITFSVKYKVYVSEVLSEVMLFVGQMAKPWLIFRALFSSVDLIRSHRLRNPVRRTEGHIMATFFKLHFRL